MPQGDPECMAPDDGEWHCHDACEPGRTAANVGDADPRTWPMPGDWPLRLLGYLEACHIWLNSAGWSVTANAPQHDDPYRQLFAGHRLTANAVDQLLREWLTAGFVALEGDLPADGDDYGDRRARLTDAGYALLREIKARYGR